VLRQLDPERKTEVMQFLSDSGLAFGKDAVIQLYGADLSGVDLSSEEAVTRACIQHGGSNVSESDFVSITTLEGGCITLANLALTDWNHANLSGADLSGDYLYGANLSYANLERANLTGAWLQNVDFTGAILTGAQVTDE